MMRTEQITRDHPDYHHVCDILRLYPELVGRNGERDFIRVPDEQAWMVYPDTGRPYLEVEVFKLDDNREPVIDWDACDVVVEDEHLAIYID